jgi:hypothetical protein
MSEHWKDYDKEPLEIHHQETWEVLCPWDARLLGIFHTQEDAEFFVKKFHKKWRKSR